MCVSTNYSCLNASTDPHPQVRIYEVGAGGQSQGKALYQHQGPVMGVCWNKAGH